MSKQIDGDLRLVGSKVEHAPQNGDNVFELIYTGGIYLVRNATLGQDLLRIQSTFGGINASVEVKFANPLNGNQSIRLLLASQTVRYDPNFGVDQWREIYGNNLWRLRNETQGFDSYKADGLKNFSVSSPAVITPDAFLLTSHLSFSIDESGNVIKVKAKYSNGTTINVFDIPLSGAAIAAHDLGGASHTADTLANLSSKISDATLIDTGDSRLSDARTPTAHTHAAADVNSGTFVDGRIAESNVTQHEGAIDHNALLNFLITQHRIINDSGSTTTELLSASKILDLVAAVTSGIDIKDPIDTVADTNITLSGEQTINGVTTSASRVAAIGQTDATENGFYLTAAGAWSRTEDADEDAEVTNGMATMVLDSLSTFFRHRIILSTSDPITVGVTALSFVNVPDVGFGTTAGTSTEGNDPRVLTQDENDAAVGTDGVASSSNKFLTNSDSRNADSRAPTNHASDHTDGTDDIQNATAAQKGLATAAQITKLDGIEALAEVNDVDSVFARTGAVVAAASDYDASQIDNDSGVTGAFVDDALDTLNAALVTEALASEPIIWRPGQNNAASEINSNEWFSFGFEDGSTREVVANFDLPSLAVIGASEVFTVVIPMYVSLAGGGNNDIHLTLEANYVDSASGELITKSENESLTNDFAIINTLNRLHKATFTLDASLMGSADTIRLVLGRVGTDVNDTFTGDIGILTNSKLQYTKSTT